MRLSQSKLKAWLYCPGAYYYQYILGLQPYNPNFDYGTSLHLAREAYHTGKSADPADLDPRLLAYIASRQANYFAPENVERKFAVKLSHPETNQELAWEFSGIVDGLRPGGVIEDFKTSNKSWSQAMADNDLQPTAYLYWWWQTTGELLPFTFVVHRKDWTPSKRFAPLQEVTTTRTISDFTNFWLLCHKVIADISSETNWQCTCRNLEHV